MPSVYKHTRKKKHKTALVYSQVSSSSPPTFTLPENSHHTRTTKKPKVVFPLISIAFTYKKHRLKVFENRVLRRTF
jgi:hypothetical protein